MTGIRWGAWLNVVAGAIVAMAPFAFGYNTLSSLAMYEAVAVGVLIAGLSLWSAVSTAAPAYLDYVVAAVGGWSILAPFVLGYYETVEVARNADIVMGMLVAAIALAYRFKVSPLTRHKVSA